MIIELVGAPGSGKTTLRRDLLDCLNKRSISARTPKELAAETISGGWLGQLVQRITPAAKQEAGLWLAQMIQNLRYRPVFALHHPRLVWRVIRYQRARPATSLARNRRSIRRFLSLVGTYEWLAHSLTRGQAMVFDEGFVQRVVLLFTSHAEPIPHEAIRQYLLTIPPVDQILFLRAPIRTCVERVIQRGIWGPYQDKSVDEIETFIQRAAEAVYYAVQVMREQGIPVIQIENANEGAFELGPILQAIWPSEPG